MPFLSAEIMSGIASARPSASSGGRLYFETDTGKIWRDTGSAWTDVTPTSSVTSVAGKTGAVSLVESDISGLVSDLAAKAPLASPALTGNPTAPTQTGTDNSTRLATTAFVQTAVAGVTPPVTSVAGRTGAITLAESDISGLVSDLAAKAPITQPFLIVYSWPGIPPASLISYIDIPSNLSTVSFPANFAGSVGKCSINPTATAVYTIKLNGTTVGTITISTSGTFTFATTGGTSFTCAASDELSIISPTVQDATLSDPRFSIAGSR